MEDFANEAKEIALNTVGSREKNVSFLFIKKISCFRKINLTAEYMIDQKRK